MSHRKMMPDGVCRLSEGGILLRGHHTTESAVEMLNELIEAEVFMGGGYGFDDEIPPDTHFKPSDFCYYWFGWWRWVPDKEDGGVRLCEATPHARGAFEAALLDY